MWKFSIKIVCTDCTVWLSNSSAEFHTSSQSSGMPNEELQQRCDLQSTSTERRHVCLLILVGPVH